MPAHEIFYAGVLEAQLIKKVDLKVISKVVLDQCFYMDILPRLSARLPLYIATGDWPKWALRVKISKGCSLENSPPLVARLQEACRGLDVGRQAEHR